MCNIINASQFIVLQSIIFFPIPITALFTITNSYCTFLSSPLTRSLLIKKQHTIHATSTTATTTNTFLSMTMATKATTPSNNNNNNNNNTKRKKSSSNNEKSTKTKREVKSESSSESALHLLESWVKHDTQEFHNFSKEEAFQIRNALLIWYRISRRKLPWRGDCPPFDGSTAGVNNNVVKNKKDKNKEKQVKIDGYFVTPVKEVKKEIKDDDNENRSIIPVSGYSVWVSEIMLQQTRVEAVIPYYLKWMESFPTVKDLAAASEEEVNSHWAGLGFYRRARLLHKGSKYVVENLNGTIPNTVENLLKLDGIGPYTASAIASIAYNVCVPVVDGNVCRVLSRLRGIANHIKAPILKDKYGWILAQQIVEAGDGSCAGEVNQALMELGATYCAPSGSGVDERDPLKDFYMSTKLGRQFQNADDVELWLNQSDDNSINKKCSVCGLNGVENIINEISSQIQQQNLEPDEETTRAILSHSCFPIDPPKKPKREEVLVVAVFSSYNKTNKKKTWFMQKRPSTGLLAGQWEFPCICTWEHDPNKKENDNNFTIPELKRQERRKSADLLQEQLFSDETSHVKHDTTKNTSRTLLKIPIVHIFSHIRHTMYVENRKLPFEYNSNCGTWMSDDDMKNAGITSGMKKILRAIQKEVIE